MADIKDVIETLDTATAGFEKVVAKSQMKIYEEAVTLIKELDLDALGRVKQSIANLKRLNSIKAKLKKVANNDQYLAGLGKFVSYFDTLATQQREFFTQEFAESLQDKNTDKTKRELIRQQARENTIAALSGDGLASNVTAKINDMLVRAVTSGARYADLTKELHSYLQGEDGGQGALARYATTYATTAISQYTGQNNKLMTDGLETEWFMYVGSTMETTREFCDCLTAKRYIHRSEFRKILSGNIDGHQCKMYAKTGLPLGMIEGTNEENFQVNCGGWNCRHQLVPVHELAVPADVRAKFEAGQNGPQELTDYQKQGIERMKAYIVDHPGSGKIKKYLETVEQMIAGGDLSGVDPVIKAAIADMNKFEAAKRANQKRPKPQKPAAQSSTVPVPTMPDTLGNARMLAANNRVAKKVVKQLQEVAKEDDIIQKLAGGDMTSGSCSSLAFAYAGQKGGLDVIDFRGSGSRKFFATGSNIREIVKNCGGQCTFDAVDINDIAARFVALQSIDEGVEYYFTALKHAAIIKRTGTKIWYLELQSHTDSGWHELTFNELQRRFGYSKSLNGAYCTNSLVKISQLYGNKGYKDLLAYINTDASKQKKSAQGSIK